MLGTLGMLVQQTIRHYGTLAGDIFSDKQTGRDRKFKASKLEKNIKEDANQARRQAYDGYATRWQRI